MGRRTESFYTTDSLSSEIAQAAQREGVSKSEIVNRALAQHFATKITRSSWDTEDVNSWYDERKFYTYSEDKKGHSIQIRLWVPKNVAGQIGRVVNSEQIPEYRSAQDFYRDALLHRAFLIAQWLDDGELKAETGLVMMMAEEDAIKQAKADVEALIESTRENLQSAWDKGDYEWIERHIQERMEKATSIPENYRDDYIRLLKRFRTMIEEASRGKVSHMRKARPETAN